ncbi:MAG: hypothetical protein R2816_05695 [Flavobacteriaceae bacterium]|nr:hypothetical protein [Flavobacteriaceae bacterium]
MKTIFKHLLPTILLVCFTSIIEGVQAQNNSSLYDIPTAESVLKNIKGNNKKDTYAKQYAALVELTNIVKTYKSDKTDLIVSKQMEEYQKAQDKVYQDFKTKAGGSNNEWHEMWREYVYKTPRFREEEVIETLFNQNAKNHYLKKRKELNDRLRKSADALDEQNAEIISIQDEEETRIKDLKQRNKEIRKGLIPYIIGLIIGIFILFKARNWNHKLREYEFKNITDGGVVNFKDFKEAERHRKNKGYSKLLWTLGVIVVLYNFMALVFNLTKLTYVF